MQGYYPFGGTFQSYSQSRSGGKNHYTFNGNEEQPELEGLMDFNARFYDPYLGRFMMIDPLADEQEDFTPYHFAYNDPIGLNDPSGLMPEGGEFRSTFVNGSGEVVEHRNDDDRNVYLVNDDWLSTGEESDKIGLSIVGHEDPSKQYNKGDQYQHYVDWSIADQGIQEDYTIESFVIPFARGIGLGLKFFGRYAKVGGKWVIEIVERGTGKVIQRFASKSVTFGSKASKALFELGTYPNFVSIQNGVAKLRIGFTKKISTESINLVEDALRANGATSLEVTTGIVKPEIRIFLNKLIEANRLYKGFRIQKTPLNPTSNFKLIKDL